ncbi:hypothetical protein [Celeribacter persicus]|uniref:Uncharacterized protein n=1 Tax=Celeribacter persicus TaxID=1651082 RepID=A0A2T5HWQ4_9RHOB|nr:hypothetical protein [Celeribacter persicus]PTQ76004.1 hypothetical protein C8N42_101549 [Celeribacter persicus]
MSRIVTILLIGVLTLFSAPRAGMAHEMSGAEMTGATQTVANTVHHHEMCPDCANSTSGSTSMDIPCPHGAICVLFTPGHGLDHRVSRTLQPVGFPPPASAKIIARSPGLDLPPPRIRFNIA